MCVWAQGQASTARVDLHEPERHEEFNLFYHGPQTTRCAPAAAALCVCDVRVPCDESQSRAQLLGGEQRA